MVYLFNSNKFNRILFSGLLITFSLGQLTLPPVYANMDIGVNDIAFSVRMEKLVERLKKYKDRGESNKLLDSVLDLKLEVEGYTGQVINIDKEIDKAEASIKNKGGHFSKKEFEQVRKVIKKKSSKKNVRLMCMESYLNDNPSMTFTEYESLFLATHNLSKDSDKDEDITNLPLRLTIGISLILAGGFLCFVGTRIPMCMEYGKQVMAAGVTFAIEGYVNRKDEDKEKDKKGK